MNLLKKYHILALTALLSACSSATLTGYSEEGKTEISAGSALPSDNHAAAVQEKTQEAASAPAKVQKIASKEENTKTKTSKVQKEDAKKADAKKTETKAEQKPLVDKITTEKDPDESDKKTAIHYMTDEEFIASVEKLDSVETTPVETEELNEPAQTSTQKSAAQSPAKEKSAPQVEAVFVPTISYQLDTFYFANGSAIPFAQAVEDPTGQITLQNATQIRLEPGYYLITYHVSAILETAGYLQVTPAYGGQGHLEYGVYARTAEDSVSAGGSNSLILDVTEETEFTLNYNSNVTSRDGAATVVVVQLRRQA